MMAGQEGGPGGGGGEGLFPPPPPPPSLSLSCYHQCDGDIIIIISREYK